MTSFPRRSAVMNPAVAQAGQVRADAGLGLAHRRHELANRALAALEQLQDAETGGVAEDPEEAGGSHGIDPEREVRYHIRKTGYHRPARVARVLSQGGGGPVVQEEFRWRTSSCGSRA